MNERRDIQSNSPTSIIIIQRYFIMNIMGNTCNTRYKLLQLGIESHFVGVHGPYELHRKEKQIKCTVLAVHENLLFFPMQFIWPVNTDKMRFNTYIYIF